MKISHSPLVIGMVLFPDLTQLDLTGPHEVFTRMPSRSITRQTYGARNPVNAGV
jgi:cyclohexyl-isocyanide hydratase